MPLSDLQTRLLRALAERRSPESYVAGASPLARAGFRYSADIDVFHDREESVEAAALADAVTLEAADAFVRAMPAGTEGNIFLRQGKPVQPDPADLESYVAHSGERHGHWPSSPDITSAMLERYGRGDTGETT